MGALRDIIRMYDQISALNERQKLQEEQIKYKQMEDAGKAVLGQQIAPAYNPGQDVHQALLAEEHTDTTPTGLSQHSNLLSEMGKTGIKNKPSLQTLIGKLQNPDYANKASTYAQAIGSNTRIGQTLDPNGQPYKSPSEYYQAQAMGLMPLMQAQAKTQGSDLGLRRVQDAEENSKIQHDTEFTKSAGQLSTEATDDPASLIKNIQMKLGYIRKLSDPYLKKIQLINLAQTAKEADAVQQKLGKTSNVLSSIDKDLKGVMPDYSNYLK